MLPRPLQETFRSIAHLLEGCSLDAFDFLPLHIRQVGIAQISAVKRGAAQISPAKIRGAKVSAPHVRIAPSVTRETARYTEY